MATWYLVATSLVAWSFVSIFLARSAEARIAGSRLPAPRFAFAAVLVVVVTALATQPTPGAAAAGGLACIGLIAAADSDARTGFLFDAVTFPAAVLTALAALCSGAALEAALGVSMLAGTFGAIVVVSRGRLLGLGDVKAMFAIGAAFGPLESLVAIFVACVSGIVAAAVARRLRRGASLRFGPHLAAGSAFALVAGNHVVHDWMGL